jgi:hypothetical protein
VSDQSKPTFVIDGAESSTLGGLVAILDPFFQAQGLNPIPEGGAFGRSLGGRHRSPERDPRGVSTTLRRLVLVGVLPASPEGSSILG